MNQPLISVIVPTYNMASTLETAIESLVAQTYPNVEIVIVDDASTDTTPEVVESLKKIHPGIVYIRVDEYDKQRTNASGRNINAGWMARNIGMSYAKGEWITFQDADDASLLNRIEMQFLLAKKYNSRHVCIQWIQFTESRLGKRLKDEALTNSVLSPVITSRELLKLSRKTRGILFTLLGPLHQYIPFYIKRARIINKLFFGSLDPYPASGNCPLIHRDVSSKIKFRHRDNRVWPSFVGRGADRDFNFRVANTFRDSISIPIPLYLWRAGKENELFEGDAIDTYLY